MTDPGKTDGPSVTETVARRAAGVVGDAVSGRVYTLLAAFMMAFASVFLLIGWQFGPLPVIEAQQYNKFTGHADARIVESWIALEFDASSVRNPEFWRASTNAAGCIVTQYDGDWGAPMQRAFCGTRTKFNDAWSPADVRDITTDVPFAWARDGRGFAVPELRVDPATRRWLASHTPNKFMHAEWPADTVLDWLRLELDDPVAAAVAGWTAPPAIVKLSFDPAHPGDALPDGIIARRVRAGPSWVATLVGFMIGLTVWFKATALLPLVQGLLPAGRWIVSTLPLLTLPWWMDAFPPALSFFSRDVASVIGDMFADVDRTDRVIGSEPSRATLAGGERLVWSVSNSIYAPTFGKFSFAPPDHPLASRDAVLAAVSGAVTAQARAMGEAQRAELFDKLARDRASGLDAVRPVFTAAAQEAAADPAAGAAMRTAARRYLQ